MINKIISAFIAIFFWGKGNKAIEENTRHASKLRTLIYFVLSIVIGVFFYKTYQVTSIINHVQINALRSNFNSSGHSTDTIDELEIFNRFGSDMNYKNDFYKYAAELSEESAYFAQDGGVRFTLNTHNGHSYPINDNPQLPDGALSSLDLPVNDPEQVFIMHSVISSFPSFIPIYPELSLGSNWVKIKDNISAKFELKCEPDNDDIYLSPNKTSLYGKNKDERNLPMNSFISKVTYVIERYDSDLDSTTCLKFITKSSLSNTMNIFTAADISQYTYLLSIQSDCMINSLYVDYDVPIEINSIDSCLKVGSKGFTMSGDLLEWVINNKAMMIHVKLPTLENLQLIRSLVLTTILTALVTLLFRNLYFLIRKWALRYRKKHYLPYSKAKLISRKRVNRFRWAMYFLLGVILVITLYLTYLIANDSPIYVQYKHIDYLDYICLGGLFVLALIAYGMYCYARKPVPENTHEKNDDSEQPFTIFLHEKNEEEELDRMMEDMRNEKRRKKHQTNSDESEDN